MDLVISIDRHVNYRSKSLFVCPHKCHQLSLPSSSPVSSSSSSSSSSQLSHFWENLVLLSKSRSFSWRPCPAKTHQGFPHTSSSLSHHHLRLPSHCHLQHHHLCLIIIFISIIIIIFTTITISYFFMIISRGSPHTSSSLSHHHPHQHH